MADNSITIARAWLSTFAAAAVSGDVDAVTSTFLPNGWLRDLLTFTWDLRSLEGHDKIASFLQDTLAKARVFNIRLDESFPGSPAFFPVSASASGVEAAFIFETPIAAGRGYFRVLQDGTNTWKALAVMTMLSDLKGQEASRRGFIDLTNLPWRDVSETKQEKNPHVLIIGGAQTGLQVAARLKQKNVSALVVERNARIGDNWRQRYPTLTLHTVREHHELLDQPFPKDWPTFTPRDKLADWLESYAKAQDLRVWTSSRVVPHPTYNDALKRWRVTVNHDGEWVEMYPTHIVVATGALGHPRIPVVPDHEKFHGEVLHSNCFPGGDPYAGKRVIVVGAGNSAADVCYDLAVHGAASVTMVQRSSTCVVSLDKTCEKMAKFWRPGESSEIGDLRYAALPMGLTKKMCQAMEDAAWEEETELHQKLRQGGLKLNMGPEGAGPALLIRERFGGYWYDRGAADLIASGMIKVKNGVEAVRLTENSLVFTDGSELPADAVIFATGYHDIRDSNRELFGSEIIDKTSDALGLDHEGEQSGCYRPSGHPGLWFATGDFFMSRFMSIPLAIQIKAAELGLIPSSTTGWAVGPTLSIHTSVSAI
ncbi:dimethylaniline monooxygenase (N-oxide-forming) [Obba rivulosa]|uniref:Dimethylaniline monooxygenase (N-oxide-forming) n=1 Tax=Obba rivulosa TaxID=1052685 RepID=A0A8E2AXC9_9APHY|nr:dimethylaniline monooxygenase (N-oxide-forming) [Obba rivulosa]